MSLPTRGGWIEIDLETRIEALENVPPHTGRVVRPTVHRFRRPIAALG